MEKIKYNQYRFYKILIVIILTIIASSFVALGNFIIPLIILAIATMLMIMLKKNVSERLTDERVNIVAGKASRIVLSTFVSLMAVAGIVLVSLRNIYPQYNLLGNILLFTECGMMLLYAILFKYYLKKKI
jgi:uncharacterized membrane protein